MISLYTGSKGSGKTKRLIEEVNRVAASAPGSVVCLEKNMQLTYEVKHNVRLVDMDTYHIDGYDAFYGFLAGVLAGNYDITDVFVDGILQVGRHDLAGFHTLLKQVEDLLKEDHIHVCFTVSCQQEELPEPIKVYVR